ncbi:DUF3696 domain-containing protein [Vibrio crassostreae]|nr:DUF3696 domain-containing protein [Vibrio crassostreae]CAK1816300.1 DUF3696 domain-containing protein [Vibrio crassostreae]CAK2428150.1 DUF3696 domain-containing protein [Vibrio crassostreae]CAK2702559.1 DUF3696 domain-containing protein [Vibrio crassostreae]CAK2755935.1 DUF3696 domain-containing protein [Vibrio crassostreae]
MFNHLYVNNFKSIIDEPIALDSLNVLSGINGSGKSTICQIFLLLKEYFEHYNEDVSTVSLNNKYMDLGRIQDILNEGASEEKIDISFNHSGSEYSFELDASNELSTNDFAKVNSSPVDHHHLKSIFSKIKYLRAERLGPRVVQEKDDYSVRVLRDIGISGEFVNSFLEYYGKEIVDFENRFHINSESEQLSHQVGLWLNEISPNISYHTNELQNTDFVGVQYNFATKMGHSQGYRATNVGFGISYILPVIVMCLSASPGDILIIDTPEAHLHPKGQSKIGELLANTAADGVQIIVETHSDHVINGIRKQVIKKKIKPENTNFYYFSLISGADVFSPCTKVVKPTIDINGMFDEWPDGFFDEWSTSLSELIKLRTIDMASTEEDNKQ